MIQNHHLAKSINDASWRRFLHMLFYKAEETGGTILEVDPRGTSQVCICGNKVEKSLAIRVHNCNQCGIEINRDVMSAMIIKERALHVLLEGQELTLGEMFQ